MSLPIGLRFAAVTLLLGALPVLTSCSDDGPSAPPTAEALVVVSGDGQTGQVGQALGSPLTVRAEDGSGAPVAGVPVGWTITAGEGTVVAQSTETDAQGLARATWTLGPTAGAQTARAAAGSAAATFSATATPGPAAQVDITPTEIALDAVGDTRQASAAVSDANGNALPDAPVTWAVDDESVATVDEDGLVTAMADGSATLTATTDNGASGTAPVSVTQRAAAVTVEPAELEITEGEEGTLTAAASDANGNPVEDETFSWSADPEGVVSIAESDGGATVTVTGTAPGSTTLTVTTTSTATVSTTAQVTVLERFEPASDTTAEGENDVTSITIPAGVTVTATGPLTFNVAGDTEIAGTLQGDCVPITLNGSGAITVTGTVRNDCSGDPGDEPPGLTMMTDGPLTLDGARLVASGEMMLGNDREAAAREQGMALLSSPAPPSSARQQQEGICTYRNSTAEVTANDAFDGADGVVQGFPGDNGNDIVSVCILDVTLDGATLTASRGGNGGDAENPAGSAVGAPGRDGGEIELRSRVGDIVIAGDSRLVTGKGGDGGAARSTDATAASATGGEGGAGGLPLLVSSSQGALRGPGVLIIELGDGGKGGEARAFGEDGADATSSAPAQPGADATAVGGKGGRVGLEGVRTFEFAVFVGERAADFQFDVTRGDAGHGGGAVTIAGDGGDGNEDLRDGGDGGNQDGRAGDGGDFNFSDSGAGLSGGRSDRAAAFGAGIVFPNRPGDGAAVQYISGIGGKAGPACLPPGSTAGVGGKGGDATGRAGFGGAKGGVEKVGRAGETFFDDVGNGGKGGEGTAPGPGGAGGTDAVQIVGDVQRRGTNFEPGEDGDPCKFNGEIAIAVQSDPNGHEEFIGMTSVTRFMVFFLSDGRIRIASENDVWTTVEGTVNEAGEFATEGRGEAAGVSNVLNTFNGSLTFDDEGVPTGIDGTLTVDAENTRLLPNKDEVRNPAVYDVSGILARPDEGG